MTNEFEKALKMLQTHEATSAFMDNVRTNVDELGLYYEFDAHVGCYILKYDGVYYNIQDIAEGEAIDERDLSTATAYKSPEEVAQYIIDCFVKLEES